MKISVVLGLSVLASIGLPAPVDLDSFFTKKDVTIVVTDSGLGGLSIMAEGAALLKEAKIFRSVNLVFFNALFSNESGYNSLKTRSEKIDVFQSALESLMKNYRPDLVLIGCNTLSVLYPETPLAKSARVPVLDIVEPGVALAAAGLRQDPASVVLIFGTETTISEGDHRKRLEALGYSKERIIGQACPELAGYIEKNSGSEDTGILVEYFVDEGLAQLRGRKAPLLISLNCTHYGYALDFWTKALESRGIKSYSILNPNRTMAQALVRSGDRGRYAHTTLKAKVVSMVGIERQKIDSLGAWLAKLSPGVAAALAGYELKPDLFEWKKFVR